MPEAEGRLCERRLPAYANKRRDDFAHIDLRQTTSYLYRLWDVHVQRRLDPTSGRAMSLQENLLSPCMRRDDAKVKPCSSFSVFWWNRIIGKKYRKIAGYSSLFKLGSWKELLSKVKSAFSTCEPHNHVIAMSLVKTTSSLQRPWKKTIVDFYFVSVYCIHFQITGVPCNLTGSTWVRFIHESCHFLL